jgi:hypothetical protein
MYQNPNLHNSPASLQLRSFTTHYEPYRLTFLNLTQDSLVDTLSHVSPNISTFVERELLDTFLSGKLPDREGIEEGLSQYKLSDARLERCYRCISGYSAIQRDEFTINSHWPITIERSPYHRGKCTLSIDLPTSREGYSRAQAELFSTDSSLVSPFASRNYAIPSTLTGTGWWFADELASKLGLSSLSLFCRNGWAQAISHPQEHRVSINLSQNIQLQLYPSELVTTLSDYAINFPHPVPKEIIFLSHEPWRENQFARTINDTIGAALISSGILLHGRESVQDSYELHDDTLQECAKTLHRTGVTECTFEYGTSYVSSNLHRREVETGTPDESHLYSHFDALDDYSSHPNVTGWKRSKAAHTSTTIRCGGTRLSWSNALEQEVLQSLSAPWVHNIPRRILSSPTVDFATCNYERKNEEMSRLYQEAWSETLRIAKKYNLARNRDQLELAIMHHRNDAGYPSMISSSFYVQLSTELLLYMTTSL